MGLTTPHASLTDARSAIELGKWDDAYHLLRRADAATPLGVEALTVLGEAAYGAGEFEAAIAAFERVHTTHVRAGERLAAGAAAVTVATYLMMDTGLMAPVRGWTQRARRLLDGTDETRAHAWLAVVSAYERLMSGDFPATQLLAHHAIEVGTRQNDAAATAMGRIASARVLIFAGNVAEGLDLLDEAAVTVVAGELAPLPTGMAYCELVCAMQGLMQYDRAEEWTQAMHRWRQDTAFGGIHGRCRVHRAEILRLHGSCADAENEALQACRELRPWLRREFGWPLTELGMTRLRKGDLAGAEEALLAAHEHGWNPQPGLALLRLAQGDATTAARLIAEALERPVQVPSKELPPGTPLWRAPLLDAQAHISLAEHDLDTARRAATELREIAERFQSRALVAGAEAAHGRIALATGELADAITALAGAVNAWCLVGAPYETSLARRWLAAAYRAHGDEQLAALEFRAAVATFQRIGAWSQATETHRAANEMSMTTAGPPAVQRTAAPTAPTDSAVFRLDGDTRTVRFTERTVLLRDLKGLRYLARLLAEPGREFHVLDLTTVESGVLPASRQRKREASADGFLDDRSDGDSLTISHGTAGPLLDDQARDSYRRRLREIDEDIQEAEDLGDFERAMQAAADRDFVVHELARAFGLGGRERLAISSAERARASVTRAIRYAIARLTEHHAALGRHLDHAISTGTYCAYQPDPQVSITWHT